MSALIRKTISEKLAPLIKSPTLYYELEVPPWKQQQIKYNSANIDKRTKPIIQWSINSAKYDVDFIQSITQLEFDKNIIESVKYVRAESPSSKDRIEFILEEDALISSTLIEKNQSIIDVNLYEDYSYHHYQQQQQQQIKYDKSKHFLFEFSSPNIAKPFHVGHLRSTIIGNVLANLHEQLGFMVTKINYLGDWGTQFGFLQLGMEMLQISDEELRASPIQNLYKAYVHANNVATTDQTVAEKARQIFRNLELSETSQALQQKWQQYRLYTIQELEKTYQRLGVEFDVYDWESQYSQKHIENIFQKLEEKNLLFTEISESEYENDIEQKDSSVGRKLFPLDGGRRLIPLTRSDGSSLYLARDIAALLDRYNRYNFDQHFYVVENGQSDHFNACFQITSELCESLKSDSSHLHHVKFGRIHGMSTRKGEAIFLSDLLDEARDRMHLKQLQSPTTKVKIEDHLTYCNETADILGITAVIVNDLKQRRQRDYVFNWDKALQMNGDTGIKLQYTHCRLNSLIERNAHLLASNEIWMPDNGFQEPEAFNVLCEIIRFPQIIWQASQQLEACVLVNYLFALCNATSRALKQLPVQNETNRSRQLYRLNLFKMAKKVLGRGMEILGLKPLKAM